MPIAARQTPLYAEPDALRPYTFHGCDLSVSSGQATGDCPFCFREGKFSVELVTTKFKCWSCGYGGEHGGGNATEFMRSIYRHASERRDADFYDAVAADRRLSSHDTVAAWGIVKASDGTWLVPGYSPNGVLHQVYRRTRIQDKGVWVWRLLPTPGIWGPGKSHALHLPIDDFDPACTSVYICEGPWDGMALWEAAKGSSIAPCQIVAVPGCNVWQDTWTEFCRGKNITLLFDSDHPREVIKGHSSRAGYDGMVRIAKRLSGVAASVRWLRWGPDGYDPNKPSGWDVRDNLTSGESLDDLISKIEDTPYEWFISGAASSTNGTAYRKKSAEALPCEEWASCEVAWAEAMQWRQELADALAVLLAVAASTKQAGNQLFLDLVGAPGSAKTTLCRGLLVSHNCIHLENMTKLVSGYKLPDDPDKDCSFLARANGKTWITCEFDTVLTSPEYVQLMGKIRRIFDGETTATYGNSDKDRIYNSLRTPWIRAGTHRMMDHDQSQLGDRFMRYIIGDPIGEEKRSIVRAALRSERAALVETANGTASSIFDPKIRLAHALTGGYVDWLRENAEEKLAAVEVSEVAEDYCIDLAEISADLRARPNEDKRRLETHDTKELPTRLARQNIRLASCLAVVLNKTIVDATILKIVKKVALDTAFGHTRNIVEWLCSPNPKAEYVTYQESGGLQNQALQGWTGMLAERLAKYLTFLRKIDVIDWREIPQMGGAWVLTDRVYDLYQRIKKDE